MTWEEFEHGCKKIMEFFTISKIKIENIYGIPKGGLVVAVRLCSLLNKELIIDETKITKDTLIVDDIIDTGKTTEKYRKKGMNIAVLYYNPSLCPYPPLCWIYQKVGKWVIFPWE